MSSGRIRRPRWLTRNVATLSAVSMAQDAASELLYPLLPILLTVVLGAPAAVVGIVEGIAEGAGALLKYVSGRYSDRIGRKPLVAAGYGLAALGKVVVAAAAGWPLVLAGRVTDRLGKGVRGAPRDALLADGVDTSDSGKVFGFHRAADTIGAVVGPLLGLAVLAMTDGDVRDALWFAVIPATISVALVALAREQRRRPEPGQRIRPTAPLPGRVKLVALLLGGVALVNFPDALLLLRMSELGFGTTAVVACYALFNAANAAIAYPAGALSDRMPRARVYALGLVCFAVGYCGLAVADDGWQVIGLLIVYGGFAGITDGVGKAWISALSPPESRGHAQGLLQGLAGAGVLAAGLWAGLAWESGPGSGVVPLLASGILAGAAALGLWVLGPRIG